MRDRLAGLVACLAIAGIVVGLPLVLLALGADPLPSRLPSAADVPSWDDVVERLTAPDDGTLAYAALQVLGWVIWLVLTGAILLEILALARGARTPRLPGFRLPQSAARSLVATALMLFLGAPLTLQGAAAADATSSPLPAARTAPAVTTTPASSEPSLATPAPAAAALAGGASGSTVSAAASGPMHVVQAGDSLWSIAEVHLGSGHRYLEVADLNTDVLGDRPGFLTPGTVLRLPTTGTTSAAGAVDPAAAAGTTAAATGAATAGGVPYVVEAGDTLSGIAQEQLGDARRYPEVFNASTGITQPTGARLTDPDVIDVGWTLAVPAAPPAQIATGAPAAPAAPSTAPSSPIAPPAPPGAHDAVGDSAADSSAPQQPAAVADELEPTPPAVATEGGTALPADAQPPNPDAEAAAPELTAGGEDATLQEQPDVPEWVLLGLTGAGALLAGALAVALHRRRRTQARSRRPGRTLPVPDAVLAPVEKTIDVIGSESSATVELMDEALRRLAASRTGARLPMPDLAAVELAPGTLVLHLRAPTSLPAPWQGSPDALAWSLSGDPRSQHDRDADRSSHAGNAAGADHDGDLAAAVAAIGPLPAEQPAPYPLLVTIGATDSGDLWLLNCEEQVLYVTGDPTYGRDLVRYLAAEIAVNPWSQYVRLTCVGVAEEVHIMNPDRIHVAGLPRDEADISSDTVHGFDMDTTDGAAAAVLADAVATLTRLGHLADSDLDAEPTDELAAVPDVGRGTRAGTVLDAATARAVGAGSDVWAARMLLVDVTVEAGRTGGAPHAVADELGWPSANRGLAGVPGDADAEVNGIRTPTAGAAIPGAASDPTTASSVPSVSPVLDELLHILATHAGQTATSVVLQGDRNDAPGMVLDVTATGRVQLRGAGLDLVAVGLTRDEALGCAALLAQAEDTTDTPIPAVHLDHPENDPKHGSRHGSGDDSELPEGWRAWANEAGALRTEHTFPRAIPVEEIDEPVTSLLEAPDVDYVRAAATTADDLAVLAPHVPLTVRDRVEDSDPTLDGDVAAWHADDCPHPRLRLLGPVGARTRGIPVTKRKPFYTEVLAYLATRPHGAATPAEFGDALTLSAGGARNAVHVVREWLGTNPATGAKYLPDAREAPAAVDRGVAVYQVVDVLVDADLFRRLRVRGEARGEDGIPDLVRALALVTGPPLDKLRPGGWSWLHEGDRLDQHLLCAIVDVAHIVTTHSLRAGNLVRARDAAELAALAAPYEEIPRLDLAAVAAAEGHHHEARRIVLDDVCNRTDDDGPPDELSPRTERILADHDDWLTAGRAAS